MTNDAFRRAASSRRRFLGQALTASAASLIAGRALAEPPKPTPPTHPAHPPAPAAHPAATPPSAAPAAGALELPPLPYAQNALEPHISANTLSYHYGKHHKGYYDKVNAAIAGTPLAGKTLDVIVKESAKNKAQQKLFNSAAQAWNHNFYWQSMKPKGGGAPTGELATRIEKDFGSYDKFKTQFITTGNDHFSNGWVWLVLEKNKLKIIDTHDADTPFAHGIKPVLVSDIWEHAYYLDYKNLRKDYLTAFVDHLLNWDFVAKNLA
jgi:Fe-Mn family superoxide dismutase